jgi:Tfp pilus assembly protein PilV
VDPHSTFRLAHRAAANRAGFTLVELVMALFALNVALLALVAGAAVTLRRTTEARAHTAALEAATNRLQQLSVTACAPASGSASGRPLAEHWSIALVAPRIRDVVDSVDYGAGTLERTLVLRTRSPC